MKFNNLTYNLSVGISCVTVLYTLVYSGLTGLLLCSAIALIAAAFVEQFELVVAISVIFALFYTFYLKRFLRKFEPFQNHDNPKNIMNRINGMNTNYHQVPQNLRDARQEPAGVYDPAVEGFEDVQPQVPKEGESQESSSAPSRPINAVDPQQVKEVTSTVTAASKRTADDISKEEFESATGNLFKTGKMPSENMDGPKLDAGGTLAKAMSSLKPETLKEMTSSSKDLVQSQKTLMELLTNMRPVLQEGQQLLQTFSGMFGSGMGGGAGMPFKL